MLMTLPWAPWLQLRLYWRALEFLYKPNGVVYYGLFWGRTFKIIWKAGVVFSSCGHPSYWCDCWL